MCSDLPPPPPLLIEGLATCCADGLMRKLALVSKDFMKSCIAESSRRVSASGTGLDPKFLPKLDARLLTTPDEVSWAMSCFSPEDTSYPSAANKTFSALVNGGCLQALIRAREERPIKPSWRDVGLAARLGHLHVLQWMASIGCDLDEFTYMAASSGGHVGVLAWMRDQKYAWDANACLEAARAGHLDVLRWLVSNGCPWRPDCGTFSAAVEGRNLDVVVWLHSQGCQWSYYVPYIAARKGLYNILKWLCDQGCPMNALTFEGAAENGNVEILTLLLDAGCPWNSNVVHAAARAGNIDALIWFRDNGIPWDQRTMLGAVSGGRLDVVKFLYENGCPLDRSDCMERARFQGQREIMCFLHL